MTVPASPYKVIYTADGTKSSYPYTFRILQATDLLVQKIDTVGNTTTLTYLTDYTVDGVLSYTGGNVNLVAGNLTVNYTLVIADDPVITQLTSLQENGALSAKAIENSLDLLTMQVRMSRDRINRSPLVPLAEAPTGGILPVASKRASTLLGFDAFGNWTTTAQTATLTASVTVGTIATLKSISAPVAGVVYAVSGYYAPGDGGGGLFYWNVSDVTADNGGTVIQLNAGGTGRWNRIYDGMVNVRWFGAKADGVTNDVPAITAANTYLGALASKGTLYFPNGTYFTTSGLSIPEGVSWRAEEPGWSHGAAVNTGVVIYKQHTSDAVTISNSNTYGQYIDGVAIVGRGPLDVGGSGFALAKAAVCVLRRCNVFHVYLHSFVIGDGTASAYTNTLEDCYSNNPETGSNYVINSTLFRGHKLTSDGGLYGISFSSVATNWSIGECHFEGWKTNGMLIANSQGKTYGKTYLACTFANTLTGVLVNGSASGITLTGLQIANASAGAGSIGVSIAGTSSGITIRDSTISSFAIGVNDVSTASPTRALVEGCIFNTCTKGIFASVAFSNYLNNFFVGSTLYDVEHNGGTNGLWAGNKMSLAGDFAFKPTFSGQSGNFNGNCVKNNQGYVSRNSGYVASLANNGTINHGLAAAPLNNGGLVVMTPTNTGLTSPICVYSPDATKFFATWTGTTPNSFTWEARLVCDF